MAEILSDIAHGRKATLFHYPSDHPVGQLDVRLPAEDPLIAESFDGRFERLIVTLVQSANVYALGKSKLGAWLISLDALSSFTSESAPEVLPGIPGRIADPFAYVTDAVIDLTSGRRTAAIVNRPVGPLSSEGGREAFKPTLLRREHIRGMIVGVVERVIGPRFGKTKAIAWVLSLCEKHHVVGFEAGDNEESDNDALGALIASWRKAVRDQTAPILRSEASDSIRNRSMSRGKNPKYNFSRLQEAEVIIRTLSVF